MGLISADPVKYDLALCHKRTSGDCCDHRDPIISAFRGLQPVGRHARGRCHHHA